MLMRDINVGDVFQLGNSNSGDTLYSKGFRLGDRIEVTEILSAPDDEYIFIEVLKLGTPTFKTNFGIAPYVDLIEFGFYKIDK